MRKYQRKPGTRSYADYKVEKLDAAIRKIATGELSINQTVLYTISTMENTYEKLVAGLFSHTFGFSFDLLKIRISRCQRQKGAINLSGKDCALALNDRREGQLERNFIQYSC